MERNSWTQRLTRGFTLLLVLLLHAAARAEEAPDYRSRFFEEILTPEQTAWTHRFNAYEATSYMVDKADLVKSLPAVARARRKTLLGVLVIGPIGVFWSYHIVTFVREGTRVRVVAVAFPHARLVDKSSGSISSEEYVELSRELREMGGVESVRDVCELERTLEQRAARDDKDLSAEWQVDFVFTSYDASGVAFGKVAEERNSELKWVVAPLLRSLNKTYGHGQHPPRPLRRSDRSVNAGLVADITTEPVPELDEALAAFGFAGFDSTVLSFGLGGDVMFWRRMRVGYDITFGGRRAEHRALDAHATWSTLRVSPRVGFEFLEFDGFSASFAFGLRWDNRTLHVDGRALGGDENDDLALERNSLGAELSILSEYYLARTHNGGFFIGTRIGTARGFAESDFEPDSVVGNPETLSRGVFGSLYLGLGGGF